jgi:hypothetical protein
MLLIKQLINIKNLIIKFFNFYINSSLHVSLAVVCFQYITLLKFDINVDYILLIFSFCLSLNAYNFIKYFEIVFLKSQKKSVSLKLICFLTFISIETSLVITTKLTDEMLVLVLLMSLLTLFYFFPFNSVNKNLRKTPGLKIFIVAIVWSLLIVVLPIINFTDKLDTSFLIYFTQVLIFVIVTIFPFEIRDLNSDSKKLHTIPQRIGVNNTKVLGFSLLFIFMILDCIQYGILYFIAFKSILVNGVVCLTTFILILKSTEKQSVYFSSFWVESLPILWLLLYAF